MYAVEGIENLTEEQKKIMERTNKLHTQCVGNDYKKSMQIKKVWIDENKTVCVRLKNNQWYHYTKEGTWY